MDKQKNFGLLEHIDRRHDRCKGYIVHMVQSYCKVEIQEKKHNSWVIGALYWLELNIR
jgi:hypothetical protein